MNKADAIHQICWAVVPGGTKSNVQELPIGLQITTVMAGSAGALGQIRALSAGNMEKAVALRCAGLPDEIDLNTEHYEKVLAAANGFMDCAGYPSQPENPVAFPRHLVVGKLRDLAEAEGRVF